MEPWNMLSNHFTNCTNQLGVQNMEIKLEPIDPDDSTEPLELVETMHNIANNANGNMPYFPKNRTRHTTGSTQRRYLNERDMDNTIFDFGLESIYGNEIGNRVTSTSNELTSLSAEDQYYLSLIKFEDSIVYICPACGQEFRAQEIWKRHLNMVHNYNTRHGLNFIQLDKLYHKCLECNKRIAMHSMENLLKHKFTHLPYRCSKCNVCKRQYKYRQDLMVHIRLIHRDELLIELKNGLEGKHKQHKGNLGDQTQSNNLKKKAGLAIGDVKENAYDIFENSCDNVEIKNEFIDPNDPDDGVIPPKRRLTNGTATIPVPSSYIEDVSSTGSIGQSDFNDVDESLEEYILFNCPQCGVEFESQVQWRQHIDFVHDFTTRKGLNFQDINIGQQQAQCLECRQVVTPNTISNLQSHKFSHLPDSEWLKCKLCFSSFSINKRIIEHLAVKHRLHADNILQTSTANNIIENVDDDSQDFSGFDDYDNGAGAADTKILLAGHDIYTSHTEEQDKYDKYIEYICPKCGKEYTDKKRWRKHFVNAHQLADFHRLNFDIIKDRQLKCRECKKIITNAYDIQNAQQHSITHMKYNAFARCRLCLKSYTDRKTLYKHLRSCHSIDISGLSKRLLSPKSIVDANYNCNSMNGKIIAVSKQKEIVHFGDCTYEIYYLDEDDNSSSNMGISAKDDEDFEECSEYIFNKSLQQAHCHKCKNCGAIFSTHPALLFHMKNEHGSTGTNNSSNTSRQNSDFANEDLSNDCCEDLLVPTGDVDIQLEEAINIDCNFIYLCPQCGEEFRIQSLWRRHINIEHNFDKRDFLDFRCIDKFHYQCKVCKDIVQSSKLKGLQDHKFRHCPYKLYLKCLRCGTCYNHKPNMLTHLRQRHNIMDYQESSNTANSQLTTNNYEYTNSKHIKSINDHSNGSSSNSGCRPRGLQTVEDVISFHNAVDHDSITYHCPSCYENFTSHVFWRKHIVEVHKLNSREGLNFRKLDAHHYVCLQCYKRVTVTHTKGAIGQLQSHKFRHLPYKSFRCTVCQGQFVRKQMFFKHLDRNTNKCNGYNDDFYSGNNDRSYSDQYDDDFDLSGALVQRNGGDIDNMDPGLWSSRYSLQSASNDSSTDKQDCYTVNCPQCGAHFEGIRTWREHINSEHKLNTSSALNLKKISARLHQCLQCHEYMHDSKLYDLQVHRFKHLPYGAYIHCRYCRMSCYHFSRMQEHLKRKHPQMLHKTPDDMGYYNADDDCAAIESELDGPIDIELDANGDVYPDCDNDNDNDGEMDPIDADGYAQVDNAVDVDADMDSNANANVDGDVHVIANANVDDDVVANANIDDAEVDEDDVVNADVDADTENATNIHEDAEVEENDGIDAEDNSCSDDVDLVEVEADIEEVDPDAADSEEQYLLG